MNAIFTEDELHLLAGAPHMIGSAMAMAGKSGFIGTGKEMFASAKSVLDGVKTYPHNSVIQKVLPNVEAGVGAAMGEAKETREWLSRRMKEGGIASREDMQRLALEDSRAAAALVDAKASPTEAGEYKQWALSVAERVAMAASEGGFLGFGGEQFSEPEKAFLSEIEAALGVSSNMV
ncbi:MAG: hypothetical protein R3F54_20120 [Alphaproteobacteria bacterium]